MSSSDSHSHKAIFDFAKLAGTQNFFIWQARMMDVLIREKLWDVVSGEKSRPADPNFLESDTSTDAARTQAQAGLASSPFVLTASVTQQSLIQRIAVQS
jgi:hypothetical protein